MSSMKVVNINRLIVDKAAPNFQLNLRSNVRNHKSLYAERLSLSKYCDLEMFNQWYEFIPIILSTHIIN